MQEKKQLAKELFDRYLSENCTEQERNLIERTYVKKTQDKRLNDDHLDIIRIGQESWCYIAEVTLKPKNSRIATWKKIFAAASLLAVIGLVIHKYQQPTPAIQSNRVAAPIAIVPGGNKATLTLADGSTIVLNSDQSGIVLSENSVNYNDGSVVPQISDLPGQSPQILTLSTPRGGQYQLVLSDGTRVWLNAASSLRYPTQFAADRRTIELVGEAYFEVSPDKARPFMVKTDMGEIKVLGTHFNVMAYPNTESIFRTTLFEGAVTVSNNLHTKTLAPGQQLRIIDGRMSISSDIDLEEIIAWKNGYFKFNENLESIMMKLSRWYDFEIVYETKPDPNMTYFGKISRDKHIDEIFGILESTGNVHLKIKGRSVIVMK
ncbi:MULTISPECIES: FecR family protein [Sphingobacterium]|uniref:FecR family protein n=1 Tax=Sphingobacterium TaxID=28453 RepID=UPI0013DC8E61|nr:MULTISPECIES: FecR family protein [unclassified Sphingobacterium]